MTILDNGQTVHKSARMLYRPSIVYSAQPLNEQSFFEVKVTLLSSSCTGKVMLGVCRVPKGSPLSTYSIQKTPPYESSNFCMWHNSSLWNNLHPVHTKVSYGSIHLMDLKSNDRVGLDVSLAGDLFFYVNGQCQGLAAKNIYLESCDVYAVVTLLEGCDSISVTKSGM